MVHAPYAAPGSSTLHPELTKAFAREMLSCAPQDQTDINFCLEILGRADPVCAEAITAYISLRSGGMSVGADNAGNVWRAVGDTA